MRSRGRTVWRGDACVSPQGWHASHGEGGTRDAGADASTDAEGGARGNLGAIASLPCVLPMSAALAASCTGMPDMTLCSGADDRLHFCRDEVCAPYWCTDDDVAAGLESACGIAGPYFPFEPDRAPALSRSTGDEPTVSDSVSTLMWTGCPAGLGGADCSQGSVTGFYGQQEAVDYCDALSWAGHDDWFLPDYYALLSIMGIGDDGTVVNGSLAATRPPKQAAPPLGTAGSVDPPRAHPRAHSLRRPSTLRPQPQRQRDRSGGVQMPSP